MNSAHSLFNDPGYVTFHTWETESSDSLLFRRIYADIAGDVTGGILLSQIVFWFLPGKDGRPRARVFKLGRYWLAKRRGDWFGECRISAKQYDRAIRKLIFIGIIDVEVMRFSGTPIPHISVNWTVLAEKIQRIEAAKSQTDESGKSTNPKGESPPEPTDQVDLTTKAKSLTDPPAHPTTKKKSTRASSSSSLTEKEDPARPACVPSSAAKGEHGKKDAHQVDPQALIESLLVEWNRQFPDKPITDADRRAAEELVRLGVRCYAADRIPRKFVGAAGKLENGNLAVLLQRHGAFIEERARVADRFGLRPGNVNDVGLLAWSFLANWGTAFHDTQDRKYGFQKADFAAALEYFSHGSELSTDDLVYNAKLAWKKARRVHEGVGWDPWFFCRKSLTVSGFFKFYERILQELEASAKE